MMDMNEMYRTELKEVIAKCKEYSNTLKTDEEKDKFEELIQSVVHLVNEVRNELCYTSVFR